MINYKSTKVSTSVIFYRKLFRLHTEQRSESRGSGNFLLWRNICKTDQIKVRGVFPYTPSPGASVTFYTGTTQIVFLSPQKIIVVIKIQFSCFMSILYFTFKCIVVLHRTLWAFCKSEYPRRDERVRWNNKPPPMMKSPIKNLLWNFLVNFLVTKIRLRRRRCTYGVRYGEFSKRLELTRVS